MPVERLIRSTRSQAGSGIVHLGLGAFFRAFGCVFMADAMAASGGDWNIIGVSLRSSDTRDALAPQGWAYTAVSLHPEGDKTRLVEVLNDVLVAPEKPEAVLAAMAAEGVKIVTLTVTEKGYCHVPGTGQLNTEHPDIQHDLSNPVPVTAVGYLVRALERRRAAGLPPFTVLTCDNLPDNGRLVRDMVLQFASRIDPALSTWIASEGRFPSTMVDRITPATTEADIARVEQLTGYHDAAPVMHEPFSQFVIEDDFVAGQRPDFAAAGAEMVASVTAHEHMKLRMLNGTHSALAYAGYLAGHETIADTMADPVFTAYARRLWAEIMPAVEAPESVDLAAYAGTLCARYINPAIRHRTWQIAMDGSQKLPQRILGTLRTNLDAGRECPGLCLAIAAWMRYVGGTDESGQPIVVKDPLAARLRSLSDTAESTHDRVTSLLGVQEIFPADLANALVEPVIKASAALWKLGARGAIASLVEGESDD